MVLSKLHISVFHTEKLKGIKGWGEATISLRAGYEANVNYSVVQGSMAHSNTESTSLTVAFAF